MLAARRSRGARKRAHEAQKLAIEKAEAAGLELSTVAAAEADPLAMSSAASWRHTAAVVPANGQMRRRSWRSRMPWPQS